MMMPRTFAIMTLAAAAALAACGDKQPGPGAAQTAASEATTSAQVAASAATSATAAAASIASATVSDSAASVAAAAAATATVAAATAASAADVAKKAAAPAAAGVDLAVGEKLYRSNCFACHDMAVAGAPKLGDKAAWAERIAQGDDVMVKHALEGFTGKTGVMPPKGTAINASDDEIRSAVVWMANQAR